jgi:hypothetical protein
MKELVNISTGSPCGFTATAWTYAFITHFNEISRISSELKGLENSMNYAPKNKAYVTANLYTKILTSADMVSDLTNANEQLTNRISVIPTTSIGLEDLKIENNYDTALFNQSVKNYVNTRYNELIAEYQSLGRMGASSKAEAIINQHHAEFRIDKTLGSMQVEVDECALLIRRQLSMGVIMEAGMGASDMLEDGRRAMVIPRRSVKKKIEDWLDENMTKWDAGKFKRSIDELIEAVDESDRDNARTRFHIFRNGERQRVRGIVVLPSGVGL